MNVIAAASPTPIRNVGFDFRRFMVVGGGEAWIRRFIWLCGVILLSAALLRFIIAAGSIQALSLPEPALGIPLRLAVLIVGILELTVAGFCLFGKSISLQIGWLVWLSGTYVLYRAGLIWMSCNLQATCIGSLSDPLQLSRGIVAHIVSYIPACLLAGSCASAAWLGLKWRAVVPESVYKMSCPSCGVHIRFDYQNLGQEIPCPQCRSLIKLRKPENLKTSCFFCKGHIEFPAHAIGEKLNCPHCKKGITLN